VSDRHGAGNEAPLARVPGHRAFWFGWYAFFPEISVYSGCGSGGAGER